ncbi:MAG: ATP-binding protein, partial [Bacteroidales bacterium]|nr:ATP-binding protein [Bacteroidales bacterium]
RRCGKSTFLQQLMELFERPVYFNFEDHRAYNFEVNDFDKLDQILEKKNPDAWFFDEIQNVAGWERYIRSAHDKGKRIFLTGSNASLLSKELGTKLTGRHLTWVLYPFSYREFLTYRDIDPSVASFKDYMAIGGFPEFIRNEEIDILQQLLEDIITRDVIVRYEIRQEEILKALTLFLISNTGKEFSYNKLSKRFHTGSVNTVINYIGYLANSYLLSPLPLFSASVRKQLANPKKIYAVDTGLIKANTLSFSDDLGRILENVVYIELCRNKKEVWYHRSDYECDFVVKDANGHLQIIQVCHELKEDNLEREINGINELEGYKPNRKTIITLNQKDYFDGTEVVPVWEWLTER